MAVWFLVFRWRSVWKIYHLRHTVRDLANVYCAGEVDCGGGQGSEEGGAFHPEDVLGRAYVTPLLSDLRRSAGGRCVVVPASSSSSHLQCVLLESMTWLRDGMGAENGGEGEGSRLLATFDARM